MSNFENSLKNHIDNMKAREEVIVLDIAVKTQQLLALRGVRWNLEREIPIWKESELSE